MLRLDLPCRRGDHPEVIRRREEVFKPAQARRDKGIIGEIKRRVSKNVTCYYLNILHLCVDFRGWFAVSGF